MLKPANGATCPVRRQGSAAGNLTGNGVLSLDYDARNRLIQAQTTSGSYRYGVNALGQRVSKSTGTQNSGSVYAYDEAGHLLGEYDAITGRRIQEHLWLGDQPIAVIDNTGALYYVLSDQLNTPRQIIDTNQQLRWRWDNQDPFGANAPDSNPAGLGNFTYNLRFPGQVLWKICVRLVVSSCSTPRLPRSEPRTATAWPPSAARRPSAVTTTATAISTATHSAIPSKS